MRNATLALLTIAGVLASANSNPAVAQATAPYAASGSEVTTSSSRSMPVMVPKSQGSSDVVSQAILQKVSRAKADLRSYATAIEAYKVDWNQYPAASESGAIPAAAPGESAVSTFRGPAITTPVAYFSRLPPDPFAPNGEGVGYYSISDPASPKSTGFILFSRGPDGKFDANWKAYDPAKPIPAELVEQSYDSTNGAFSRGDIIRFQW